MFGLMNLKGQMLSRINFSGLLIILLISCKSSNEESSFAMFKLSGRAQGTTYTIQVYDSILNFNQNEIDSILLDFDKDLSTYRNNSLVSRINSNSFTDSVIEVQSYFGQMLLLSDSLYELSNGYFDPSIKPIMDLWGIGSNNASVPSENEINNTLKNVGFKNKGHYKYSLSDAQIELIKLNPNFQLDFNAIAQGYSVDVLMKFLSDRGHSNVYIELGGEIKLSGFKSNHRKWRIGIEKPSESNDTRNQIVQKSIDLTNSAIATSGNYRKYFEEDGQRYAHTINPKTGKQNRHKLLSATVISSSCAYADALATYFMVIGLEAAKDFLSENKGHATEAYLIYSEEGILKSYSTSQ
jgi:thiamine biosynthesis lipoprotein